MKMKTKMIRVFTCECGREHSEDELRKMLYTGIAGEAPPSKVSIPNGLKRQARKRKTLNLPEGKNLSQCFEEVLVLMHDARARVDVDSVVVALNSMFGVKAHRATIAAYLSAAAHKQGSYLSTMFEQRDATNDDGKFAHCVYIPKGA